MLQVTVVQPPYFAGDRPDEAIAEFLLAELKHALPDSLIVLPEYSNVGGLSDPQRELAAMSRAPEMLAAASETAAEKHCYVAINVLEKRQEKIWNSTYLFGKDGSVGFVYDKIHLPPSEVKLGVSYGTGPCVCQLDDLRFGFLTCYDVYFQEQLEHIAQYRPDLLLINSCQRGERTDIIRAQVKLAAFRCNAFVARSSFSMNDDTHGGCSMIAAPDGTLLRELGKDVGSATAQIDPQWKYMRPAGYGEGLIRNDDFIGHGMRPEIF